MLQFEFANQFKNTRYMKTKLFSLLSYHSSNLEELVYIFAIFMIRVSCLDIDCIIKRA